MARKENQTGKTQQGSVYWIERNASLMGWGKDPDFTSCLSFTTLLSKASLSLVPFVEARVHSKFGSGMCRAWAAARNLCFQVSRVD